MAVGDEFLLLRLARRRLRVSHVLPEPVLSNARGRVVSGTVVRFLLHAAVRGDAVDGVRAVRQRAIFGDEPDVYDGVRVGTEKRGDADVVFGVVQLHGAVFTVGVADFFHLDRIAADHGCARNDRRTRVLLFEGRVSGDDGEGAVENARNRVRFVRYAAEISRHGWGANACGATRAARRGGGCRGSRWGAARLERVKRRYRKRRYRNVVNETT